MNQEIKVKWVEALRSGEYEQGVKALCQFQPDATTPNFCCLGVLTDLYIKEKNLAWRVIETSRLGTKIMEFEDNDAMLAESVQDWAGFHNWCPSVPFKNDYGYEYNRALSSLNDNGLSFDSIADLIEKHL